MSRTARSSSASLAVLLATSACLPSGDLGDGQVLRPVTGVRQKVYSPPGLARLDVPIDLSSSPVEARLELSDAGYGPPLIASGAADGRFKVDQVPASAPYLLSLDGLAVLDSTDEQDLTELAPGRADLADYDLGDPSPATLTLNVDGLAPWNDRSGLEIISAGANSWAFLGALGCPLPTPIADGVSTLAGWQIDLKHYQFCGGNHRIEGTTKKDRVVVAQLEGATTDGGTEYFHMTRYLVAPPFDLTDGQEQVLAGSMTVATEVRTLSCDVRGSRFAEQFPLVVEGLIDRPLIGEVDVLGLPVATGLGVVDSASADYLLATLPASMDTTTGPMTYAKAYTDQFSPLGLVRWSRREQVALPGATPVFVARSSLQSLVSEGTLCTAPVEPVLGFVEDLKINGHSALRTQTGVGTTGLLTWSPPSVGSAQRYAIQLFELATEPSGSGGLVTTSTAIGRYRVRGTHLLIPQGVLNAGKSYVAVVTATTSETLIDFLPSSESSLVSSPFSP